MSVIDHEGYPDIVDRIISHLPDPASTSVFRATSKAFRAKVDAVIAAKVRHVTIAAAYSPGPPMLVFRHPSGRSFLPPLTEARLGALLRVNPLTLGYASMATAEAAEAYLRKRFADVAVIEVHSPIPTFFGLHKLFPRLEALRLSGGDTLISAGFTLPSDKYSVASTEILSYENGRNDEGDRNWEDENGVPLGRDSDSDWEDEDAVAEAQSFFGLRPRKVAVAWNMSSQTCVLPNSKYPEEIHVILKLCHQPSPTKSYMPFINSERVTHIFLHFTHFESVGPLSDEHTDRLVYELGMRAGVMASICLIDADDFLSQLPEPASTAHAGETNSILYTPAGQKITIVHDLDPATVTDPDWTDRPFFDGFPAPLESAIFKASQTNMRHAGQVFEAMRMLHGLPPPPPSDTHIPLQTVPSYLPLWTTTSQEYKSDVGGQLYSDLTGFQC